MTQTEAPSPFLPPRPRNRRTPLSILVVEDNECDAGLAVAGLEDPTTGVSVTVLRDGPAALNYLRAGNREGNEQLPGLVLLGVNAPGTAGLATLSALKADQQLRRIPVIVLTASSAEREIDLGYELGAVAILAKPMALTAHRELLRTINGFWINHVLPRAMPGEIPAQTRRPPVAQAPPDQLVAVA
jgi:CheY-like chemotaxis protein